MQIRNRVRELRYVKASELLANPKNYRTHPHAQAEALRDLLREIGYADVLLARETADGKLMLVDGHLRKELTPNMKVPVVVLDVTEDESDKLLATLDPVGALAETDAKRLDELLSTVRTDSEAVGALLERIAGEAAGQTVNANARIEAPDPQIDRAAEFGAKWGTKRGQLWRIGPHRLVCGDSTRPDEVGRLWSDGCPRLRMVWTDPPYGIAYASKNEYLNRTDRGNRIQKPIANDKGADVHSLLFDALSLARLHALEGAVVYASVPSGPLLTGFIDALNRSGFEFRHILVWVKQQFVLGLADYQHRHELVLYGWLANGAHYWAGGRSEDSVFEVDRPRVSDLHPTTKPVELAARMISNSSRPTEVVYDAFSGSGTTLVACEQLGRIGCAIELDASYVAVTLERLSSMGLQPKLVE